jgi:hypothetical protein
LKDREEREKRGRREGEERKDMKTRLCDEENEDMRGKEKGGHEDRQGSQTKTKSKLDKSRHNVKIHSHHLDFFTP